MFTPRRRVPLCLCTLPQIELECMRLVQGTEQSHDGASRETLKTAKNRVQKINENQGRVAPSAYPSVPEWLKAKDLNVAPLP